MTDIWDAYSVRVPHGDYLLEHYVVNGVCTTCGTRTFDHGAALERNAA